MNRDQKLIKAAANIQEIHFQENQIAKITIEGKSICLVRTSQGLKACLSRCPHAGGDLSKGYIDKNKNIVCPVHGYRFSMDHGRDSNGEGYFLKIYKVEENEEGIFVRLE
ncbi:MAG: Rieske 2Fe-2S domain-containing protein [Ginsengibacter sp.]